MSRCSVFMITILSLMFSFTGCSLIPGIAHNEEPDKPLGMLLFYDDFSSDAIGEKPSQWERTTESGMTIVEDPDPRRGHALQISAVPAATTRVDKHLSTDDPIIVVEYLFRWLEQHSTINHYVRDENESRNVINLQFKAGALYYRWIDNSGKTIDEKVDGLQDGWNRIRLLADADQNEYYIWFNDMTVPPIGPLQLMNHIENWGNLALRFFQRQEATNQSVALCDDVSVWSFETIQHSGLLPY